MSTLDEETEALEKFHISMALKLRQNSGKDQWASMDISYLVKRIEMELDELKASLLDQNNANSRFECADIANFAMMIHDNLLNEH